MKIFKADERSFLTNGLGVIHPIKCIETKKKSLNGWSLSVEVPLSERELIVKDRILFAETKEKGGQPFRIGDPTIESMKVAFTADHVVFDSERYLLDDVRPTLLSSAAFLTYINGRTDSPSPYSMNANINKQATAYFVRKSLLEALKTAEELFGGVYDVDGFNITLKDHVGNMSDLVIAYGKNIESMTASEDWSGVCTKLLPEGPDGLLLPELYIEADMQYPVPYTRTVSFSFDSKKEDESDKTESEMIEELRTLAVQYVKDNQYPRFNYVVKADTEQGLCIGDTIPVKHPVATVNTEVLSYEYDLIQKRVKTLEFGNYSQDVKTVFTEFKQSIESARNLSQEQMDLINHLNKEGLIYIDDNEILILDRKPKESAKNVWRFGLGGIGFSSNGYAGPFETAMTMDGKINASMILTGILQSISIKGVSLECEDGMIGGWKISKNGLSSSFEKTFTYDYTGDDLLRIRGIIDESIKTTQDDYVKYDVDGDGAITGMDYVLVSKMVEGFYGKTWRYTAKFDPQNIGGIITVSVDRGGASTREQLTSISATAISNGTIAGMKETIVSMNERLLKLEQKVGV